MVERGRRDGGHELLRLRAGAGRARASRGAAGPGSRPSPRSMRATTGSSTGDAFRLAFNLAWMLGHVGAAGPPHRGPERRVRRRSTPGTRRSAAPSTPSRSWRHRAGACYGDWLRHADEAGWWEARERERRGRARRLASWSSAAGSTSSPRERRRSTRRSPSGGCAGAAAPDGPMGSLAAPAGICRRRRGVRAVSGGRPAAAPAALARSRAPRRRPSVAGRRPRVRHGLELLGGLGVVAACWRRARAVLHGWS